MTSLASSATESAAMTTPAERANHLVLAMLALDQLERDLQRLSRALAPSGALELPQLPRRPRVVRRPRVRRDGGGYPAL